MHHVNDTLTMCYCTETVNRAATVEAPEVVCGWYQLSCAIVSTYNLSYDLDGCGLR